MCRNVPSDTREEWDMLDDASFMEAVTADGQNMYKLYQRVISSDEEDCRDSDVADLECLTYQGRDCIMDFSAGGMLSPSVSDLWARMLLMAHRPSWDVVLVDLPGGDTGGPWRDVAAIRPRWDAAPGYTC